MGAAMRALASVLATALLLPALASAATPRSKAAAASSHHAAPILPTTGAQVRALASRGDAAATLVNVWATWCVPCRKEFPALLEVARAHRRDGLRLVLVSADFPEQLPAARKFLAAHGVTDTTWVKTEADMKFIDQLDKRWSGALPATLVFDRAGHPTAFWEGAGDHARFESAVAQALHANEPGKERP